MKDKIWDYIPEFVQALTEQLKKDDLRWGDTWKRRTQIGQEQRIFDDFANYWDQFNQVGTPIPWLKVVGNAFIAWVRDQSPDEFNKK